MSISRKITGDASGGSGGSSKYVDDVFSTYLYTGNGFSGNPNPNLQTVVNGVDLDDKGGMVWIKNRSSAENHRLQDTEIGDYSLSSNLADAALGNSVFEAQSDGFSLLTRNAQWNALDEEYTSWTFAKQEGFFDVVTWTGDNVVGRAVPHNLGSTPGMVIIKCVSHSSSWLVWHKDLLNYEYYLALDTTASQVNTNKGFTALPTDSELNLTAFVGVNSLNREYVAYVFADDAPMFGPDGDESIIKCGSYTGTGNDNGPEIDLGWEPQYVFLKNADAGVNWYVFDTMRGIVTGGVDSVLSPNAPFSETTVEVVLEATPTGFKITSSDIPYNKAGDTCVYMAIRRPMKPAEEFEPEELFDVGTYTGNNSTLLSAIEFPFNTDMFMLRRADASGKNHVFNRLTGYPLTGGNQPVPYLATSETAAISDAYTFSSSDAKDITVAQDGGSNLNVSGGTYINYGWRRAPGFFDVVTYTGDYVNGRQIPHNLGVAPEMIWVKAYNGQGSWSVYTAPRGGTEYMLVDTARPSTVSADYWNDTDPTDQHITISGNSTVNTSGITYMAMMWASVPGVCDIGSYTGNGTGIDVDCGFTNGARFVLVKRTDVSGNWHYADTLRGITANTPTLQLNATSKQSADGFIQPFAGGFRGDDLLDISGAEYIYMAIA